MRSYAVFFPAFLSLFLSVSCHKQIQPDPEDCRKVFVLMSFGYNNLSSSMKWNQKSMESTLPYKNESGRCKVIFFNHLASGDYNWTSPVSPVLMDVYRDNSGKVVMDTLRIYPDTCKAVRADIVRDVLETVKKLFPAKEYGLMLSSHGTGWLPENYYLDEETDDDIFSSPWFSSGKRDRTLRLHRVREYKPLPGPAVKSVGAHFDGNLSAYASYEMELKDFAEAIPYHLKYIILDLCLMGGVETAAELAGKTDFLCFSPTEILSDGFCYKTLLPHLFREGEADLVGVCEDYYNYYHDQSRSATVSMVDCSRMRDFESVCSGLFEKYRTEISRVNPSGIQPYFREDKHWFYDIRDILLRSGAETADLAAFDAAIGKLVVYKAATDKFLSIPISKEHFSGLSMYLPSDGSDYLNEFYRNLKWNKSTLLVK